MRRRKGERASCDKPWADLAELESPSVVCTMLQRQLSEPVPGRVSSNFEAIAENRLLIKSHVESRCELPGIARSTFLMVFSPDGKKIASTHGNHCVYITDVKTGKNLNILSGHPRTPWCIAFHPSSNQILATGCLGGQVRVWDLHGGSEMWMTRGETVIASLAFHPVDHMLVIATYNELYFWDWSKPAPFAKCHTANAKEKVRYVSFDESGHSLVTGISNMQPQVTQWDRGGPDDWSASAGRTQDDSGRSRTLTAQLRALLAHYEQLMDRQPSPRSPSLVDRGTDPMEVEQGTSAPGAASPTGCPGGPPQPCPLHTNTSIQRASSLENLILRGRRFRDTVMDFYNITREADDIMFQLRRQELPNFNVGLDLENTLRSVGLSVEAVRSSLAPHGQAAEEATEAGGNVESRSGGEQSEGAAAASGQLQGSGSRDQDAGPSRAQPEFTRLEEIMFGSDNLTAASRIRRCETELISLRRCLSQTAYILEQASRLRGENAYTGNHRRRLLSILVNSFRDIGQRDPTRRYYHSTASISLAASVGREASLAMGWPVEPALWDNTHGGLISENLASILMPVGDTSSEDEEPAIRFVQVALRDYVEKLIVKLGNELSVLMPEPNVLSQRMDQELIAIQANLHRMRTLYVRSSLIRDSFNSEASGSQSSGDGQNIILQRIDRAANEISAVRSKKGVSKANETASPYVFNRGLFERLRTIFGPVSQNAESSENGNTESGTPTPGPSIVSGEEDENNVGLGSEDVGSSVTSDAATTRSRLEEAGASEQTCKPSYSAEPLAASLAESRCIDDEMLPMESNVQIVGGGPGDGNIEESMGDSTPSVQGEQAVHQSQARHTCELSSRRNCANMVVLDILEETEMLVKLLNLVRSVVVKMMHICDQVPGSSTSSSAEVVQAGGGGPAGKSSNDGEARPSASSVSSSPGFDLRARALSADQDAANLISKISNWKSLHLSQSCNTTSSREVEGQRARAMFELSLINFEVKSVANNIHELFSTHGRILGVCMLSHWGYAVDTARLNVMAMFDKLKRMTSVTPEHDASSSIDVTGLVPNPPMDDAAIEQEISNLNDKINAWIASRSGGSTQSGPGCTSSDLGEGTSGSVGTSSAQTTSCPAEEKQALSTGSCAGAPANQNPSKQQEVINDKLQTAPAEEDLGTSQEQAEERSTEQTPERSHRGGWTYFPRRMRMEERFYVSPRSAFQPHVRRMQPGGEEGGGGLSQVEQSIDRLSRNLDNTLRLCRARLEVLELFQLQNLWEDLRGHIGSLQDRVHALRETSQQRGNPSVSQRPCVGSLSKAVAAEHTGMGEHTGGMTAQEHTVDEREGMVTEDHASSEMEEHAGTAAEEHGDAVMEELADVVMEEHADSVVEEHTDSLMEEHTDSVMEGHVDSVTEDGRVDSLTEGECVDSVMEDKRRVDLVTEGERVDSVAEGERVDSVTEGERVDSVTEGERVDSVTEGERVDSVTEGERVDSVTEGERVDSVTEGERVDSGTEGERVDSVTEGERVDLGTEGERVDSVTEEEHAGLTEEEPVGTVTEEHAGAATNLPQNRASIQSITDAFASVAGWSLQRSGERTMDLSPGTRRGRGTMQVNRSTVVQHLRSVMSRMNRRLSMSRRHLSVGTRSLDSRHGAASQRRTCGSLRVQAFLLKMFPNRGNPTERSLSGDRGGRFQGHSARINTDQPRGDRRPCGGMRGMKRKLEDTIAPLPPTAAPPPPPLPPSEDADRSSTQQPLGTMMGRLETLVARHNEQQQRFQRQLARLRTVTATDRDLYNLLQVALQITGALLSQLVRTNRRVEASEEDRQQEGGAQCQRTFMVPSVRVNDVPVSEAGPCSPPLRRLSRLGSPPPPLAQRFQHLYGDGSSPYVRPRFLHPRYVAWPDPFSSDPDNPYLGPPVIVRDLASPQTHRIQVWDFSQFHIPDISKVDENVVVSECKIHNDASVDMSRDGAMLVALLPSDHYENVTNTLGIYSLLPESRGQCLYTTNFEQNAVSVSFSPTGRHLLIGVAINRATLLTTDSNFLARIYRLSGARDGTKGRMFRVRNFERTREHAYMSVNCIRWLPAAGQGFVYGTNTGQLRILR